MKKGLTEMVFILDRSGSMAGLEADTIVGYNSMLEKQKTLEGEALVSTVLFDHESTVICDRRHLTEVPEMTEEEYYVRGCTALLDAVGGAIHHIGNVHKICPRRRQTGKNRFRNHHRRCGKRQQNLHLQQGAEHDKTTDRKIRLGVSFPGCQH